MSFQSSLSFCRLRASVEPPNPEHCDEFCYIQRIKRRHCSHGLWACPNCKKVYDGNAQCCSGYMDISSSSDASSTESIDGDSRSEEINDFEFAVDNHA